MKFRELTAEDLKEMCVRQKSCSTCNAPVCSVRKTPDQWTDEEMNKEVPYVQFKKDCKYCEHRHDGGCEHYDKFMKICKDNYNSSCPWFERGKCFTCGLRDTNDEECISHQHAFDWCGCDKYISREDLQHKQLEEVTKKFKHACNYSECEDNECGYCWAEALPVDQLDNPCCKETFEEFKWWNKET